MAVEFTDKNFQEEVINSDKPTLVDFWAEWCYPCKMQAPIVEEVAKEAENAKVGKLNVEENHQTAEKYEIRSIPTLMIFKDGEAVETLTGLQNKETLIKKLEQHGK